MASSKLIQAHGPVQSFRVFRNADLQYGFDENLAEETPVALIYNGISHVVMMCSPISLEDFARGFSITENIVNNISDIYSIEILERENGIELNIDISAECFLKLKEIRRNLTGRTGCGLCGAESLTQAIRIPKMNQDLDDEVKFNSKSILIALKNFSKPQKIQKKTGATHASALFDLNGELILIREDVGRHNALDKLIGASLNEIKSLNINSFVIISSRASYEMVQKLASFNLRLLVAISAPTALAVRLADQLNITLVGFARDGHFTIYTHTDRIIG